MGVLSKLAFWKKKDDFDDLGKDLGMGKDMGMDFNSQGPSPDLGMGIDQQQQPFQKYPSYPPQPSMPAPSFQSPPPMPMNDQMAEKNMEVISSKLDALRVNIESINQRLANIEAIARGEQEDQRRKRYY